MSMTEKYLVGGVAVENTLYHFDKLYDYVIPESCEGYASTGCRVMVNFRNSLRQGMIMELHRTDDISGLKNINEILDKEPVMSEELVKLAFMMKDRCFCTLFNACRAMLPTGLSLKVMYSYKERMKAVKDIAQYKIENGLEVLDSSREKTMLEKNLLKISNVELRKYYHHVLTGFLDASKEMQKEIIAKK